MPIIKYVVYSEFDINKGPLIKQQYPSPIQGDLPFFAELLLPDQIHTREEDWTTVILHKNRLSGKYQYTPSEKSTPLYILNVVNVRFDDKAHRNTIIKAIAIATNFEYLHTFKPLMLLALDQLFQTETIANPNTNQCSTKDRVLENLYHSINKLIPLKQFPMPLFNAKLFLNSITDLPLRDFFNTNLAKAIPGLTGLPIDSNCNLEVFVKYMNMNIPVRLPLNQAPYIIGDFSVSEFIRKLTTATLDTRNGQFPELLIYGKYTPIIFVLINTFLTRKRTFFLSYHQPALTIVQSVFATLALISSGGLVQGLLEKTFPYVDLSKFDLIASQDWFFAGTANPTFRDHEELWDVLYDLDENKIILSPKEQHLNNRHNIFDLHVLGVYSLREVVESVHKNLKLFSNNGNGSTSSFNGSNKKSGKITNILNSLNKSKRDINPFNTTMNMQEDEDGKLEDIDLNDITNLAKDVTLNNDDFNFIFDNNKFTFEDEQFIQKLNWLINNKHDDETILLCFRQHLDSLFRILILHRLQYPKYRNKLITELQKYEILQEEVSQQSLVLGSSSLRFRSNSIMSNATRKTSNSFSLSTYGKSGANNENNEKIKEGIFQLRSSKKNISSKSDSPVLKLQTRKNSSASSSGSSESSMKSPSTQQSMKSPSSISSAYNSPLKRLKTSQYYPTGDCEFGYFWQDEETKISELRCYYFIYKEMDQVGGGMYASTKISSKLLKKNKGSNLLLASTSSNGNSSTSGLGNSAAMSYVPPPLSSSLKYYFDPEFKTRMAMVQNNTSINNNEDYEDTSKTISQSQLMQLLSNGIQVPVDIGYQILLLQSTYNSMSDDRLLLSLKKLYTYLKSSDRNAVVNFLSLSYLLPNYINTFSVNENSPYEFFDTHGGRNSAVEVICYALRFSTNLEVKKYAIMLMIELKNDILGRFVYKSCVEKPLRDLVEEVEKEFE